MRSGKVVKRITIPDPIYNSKVLTKFISGVMKDGKKALAQRLVYQALDQVKQESGQSPLTVFETALQNISPRMEVKSRRVGGASYQVPMEVRSDRKQSLAIRWLIAAAQARSNSQYHTFDKKMAAEILAAYKGEGGAVKKKEDMQKTAQANRAFAHFRW